MSLSVFVPASNVNKEGTRENAKQANGAVETREHTLVFKTCQFHQPMGAKRKSESFNVCLLKAVVFSKKLL